MMLRKGSRGMVGTLENAHHHAKDCLPLIDLIGAIILGVGKDFDFIWMQGNNIHILEREDGAQIAFRPYKNGDDWGIDVLAKFSRTQEMRLFSILDIDECLNLGTFLYNFFNDYKNTYGVKEGSYV